MNRPTRVVMVIQEYYPIIGGAEKQLAAQAALMAKAGIDIQVVTRRYPGLIPFEVINGIPVYRMPSWGPRPLAALVFVFSAVFKIIQLRPDIIHAFELLSPATTAIAAKYWLRVPLVAKVLRGGVLGDLTKIQRGRFGKWIRKPIVCASIDKFAVISHEIDRELAEAGVPDSKRVFIPNGVDLQRFYPASANEKSQLRSKLGLPDGVLAVFAGRLEPEKRVDQVISLWPDLCAKHPDAHFLVIGIGGEAGRLQQLAGKNIHFIGAVEDVAPYFRASDIFLLPSVAEGLSNSLLEALACGLAVVATNIGGTTDLVVQQRTGWLVPPDQPLQLKAALFRLMEDTNLRQQLGSESHSFISKHYALPAIVEQLLELYHSCLMEKNRAPVVS